MEKRNKNGQFAHGNPGKPKLAENKIITRTRMAKLVDNNWDTFEKELKSLKGRAYVESFTKILPFILPTYSAINFSIRNLSDDDLAFLLLQIKKEFNNEPETTDN
jgi:hypothetical protein